MIKSPLARLLTAKFLTAAAAALATGGAALAASVGALTGHSPAPVHPGASQYPSSPGHPGHSAVPGPDHRRIPVPW
jgi:hypothetical protein